ncbi:MAG: nucleoside recognition domain-containing protein [Clostridia bacterium]|nr:nucleoside recognition domain-containing protein [Clostridia bacterium]
MLNYLSLLIMPTIIAIIITNGLLKKAPVFDHFLDGAKNGFNTSIKILPSLVGLIVAVSMLRASGFFDIVCNILSPALSKIGFPAQLVPMAIIRPISGSAALATVRDLLNTYGADSFIGRCASVMMGSSETTFYTLTIYLGSVGISKSKYALKSALIADFAGIILSVIFVRLLMH